MPSIYRFEVRGAVEGQAVTNVCHWRNQDIGKPELSVAGMTEMLTALHARWKAEVMPILHDDYGLVSTVLHEITGWEPEPDPIDPENPEKRLVINRRRIKLESSPLPDGVMGDMMPLLISGVVHINTAFAGRRRRGRMKLGPFAESQSIGDGPGNATLIDMEAALNNLLDDVVIVDNADTFDCVVFSPTNLFTQEPHPGDPYLACAPMVDVTVSPLWGTVRSRKPRTGLL